MENLNINYVRYKMLYNKEYMKKLVAFSKNIIEEERKYITEEPYYEAYQRIVHNISELFHDLKVNNPLVLAKLYEFLVEEGFLSLDKTFKRCHLKDKGSYSLPGAEIFLGHGACLNITSLLHSILTNSHFESYTLVSDFIKAKKENLLSFLFGNHVVELINYENRYIISDVTNRDFFHIINGYRWQNEMGIAQRFHPFASVNYLFIDENNLNDFMNYCFCSDKKLFSKEEIREYIHEALTIYEKNIDTFNSFYEDNQKEMQIIKRTLHK